MKSRPRKQQPFLLELILYALYYVNDDDENNVSIQAISVNGRLGHDAEFP